MKNIKLENEFKEILKNTIDKCLLNDETTILNNLWFKKYLSK